MNAELHALDASFSSQMDCRGAPTWVIKAKNRQYVKTTISLEVDAMLRVEAL